MTKIQRLSLAAFVCLVPYCLYYPYEAFSWQLNMAFLEPERWLNDRWTHPEAEIATLTRAVYFAVWSSTTLCGIACLFFALRTNLYFWRNIVFDTGVAQGISMTGVFLLVSNALHIAAACVSPMIVSWHNPDGPLPLRFWYSSTHLALIFCGLAFMLLGAVLREAIRIARENEAFV